MASRCLLHRYVDDPDCPLCEQVTPPTTTTTGRTDEVPPFVARRVTA